MCEIIHHIIFQLQSRKRQILFLEKLFVARRVLSHFTPLSLLYLCLPFTVRGQLWRKKVCNIQRQAAIEIGFTATCRLNKSGRRPNGYIPLATRPILSPRRKTNDTMADYTAKVQTAEPFRCQGTSLIRRNRTASFPRKQKQHVKSAKRFV